MHTTQRLTIQTVGGESTEMNQNSRDQFTLSSNLLLLLCAVGDFAFVGCARLGQQDALLV
jgi:hypothetical protein